MQIANNNNVTSQKNMKMSCSIASRKCKDTFVVRLNFFVCWILGIKNNFNNIAARVGSSVVNLFLFIEVLFQFIQARQKWVARIINIQ